MNALRRTRSSGALLALLSALACNAILGNESSHRLVSHSSCLLNSDCPGDEICVFATCSTPCQADKDCALGARCLTTSDGMGCVVPTQASCTADSCPDGTTCSDGVCRSVCDKSEPCRDDQQCAGDVCVGVDSAHDSAAPSLGGGGANGGGGGASGSNGEAGSSPGGGDSEGGAAGEAMAGQAGDSGGHGGTAAGGVSGSGGAGAVSGGGAPACPEGTYRCLSVPSVVSQKCTAGSWVNDQTCAGSTPACFDNKCAACADPAKDCSANTPRSCVNGAWQLGIACTGGTTCAAGACTCTGLTCGSSCVNAQTDGANCGSCGHSCQGGTCTAGKCDAVVIASGQKGPWAIATDGATLYWANNTDRTLKQYTSSGGTQSIAPTGDCATAMGALTVYSNQLWWSAMNGTCSMSTTVAGAPVENTSMWGGTTTMLSGVAASSNAAYIVDPFDNWVVSSTKGTYAYPTTTVSGIAADSAGVYWFEGTSTVKQHDGSSLGSGTFNVLSSNIPTSDGITTYASNVYFTSTLGAIYRVPNTPGTAPTPVASGQTNPSGVAVDASGVYWTDGAAGGSVKHVPLVGGSVTTLASAQDGARGIALDATTVYWTNNTGGQVMKVAK